MSDERKLLDLEVLYHMRRVCLDHMRPDSCIASAWILSEVSRRLGFDATVLPVSLSLENKAMTDFRAKLGGWPPTREEVAAVAAVGGRVVVVGDPATPAAASKWAGHLVVVVHGRGELALIDLSADQAHRPQKGIRVEAPIVVPLAWDTWQEFQKGGALTGTRSDGVTMIYMVQKTLPYQVSPDWIHGEKRWGPLVETFVGAIRERSDQQPKGSRRRRR
jgi:hypothetical protein